MHYPASIREHLPKHASGNGLASLLLLEEKAQPAKFSISPTSRCQSRTPSAYRRRRKERIANIAIWVGPAGLRVKTGLMRVSHAQVRDTDLQSCKPDTGHLFTWPSR